MVVIAFAALLALGQRDHLRRVRLPRGRTTVILKGVIASDSIDRYVLRAVAGQTMTVHVTSLGSRARFDAYPRRDRGALVDSGAEDTTDWQGELPQSGDYVISVYSIDRRADYTLEISIR